jgi:hypothetical protein
MVRGGQQTAEGIASAEPARQTTAHTFVEVWFPLQQFVYLRSTSGPFLQVKLQVVGQEGVQLYQQRDAYASGCPQGMSPGDLHAPRCPMRQWARAPT